MDLTEENFNEDLNFVEGIKFKADELIKMFKLNQNDEESSNFIDYQIVYQKLSENEYQILEG